MITLNKYNGIYNRNVSEYTCLDKDIINLPTNKGKIKSENKLTNGSTTIAMDSGRVLMFSEEDDKWYEI